MTKPTEESIPRALALAQWMETLDADAKEFFEERAAIIEYEAKVPRDEAEARARILTRAYLDRRGARHGAD